MSKTPLIVTLLLQHEHPLRDLVLQSPAPTDTVKHLRSVVSVLS